MLRGEGWSVGVRSAWWLLAAWSIPSALVSCKDSGAATCPTPDESMNLPRIYRVVVGEEGACSELSDVSGECSVWVSYLENYDRDPPEAPCNPADMSFTEIETGDCLFATTNCPDVLIDARFSDCAQSTFADCCTQNGEMNHPPACESR